MKIGLHVLFVTNFGQYNFSGDPPLLFGTRANPSVRCVMAYITTRQQILPFRQNLTFHGDTQKNDKLCDVRAALCTLGLAQNRCYGLKVARGLLKSCIYPDNEFLIALQLISGTRGGPTRMLKISQVNHVIGGQNDHI